LDVEDMWAEFDFIAESLAPSSERVGGCYHPKHRVTDWSIVWVVQLLLQPEESIPQVGGCVTPLLG
jgi:hypothetical protein